MVSKIKSLEDVKRFAKHLVNDLHLIFQPDDYFACYNLITFSAAKSAHYNTLMNESFEICEKEGADLYETVGEYLKVSNKGVKCIKDFFEKCGNLKNKTFEYKAYNDILCFYACQPLLFKHKLAPLLHSLIESSAIASAQNEDSKPSLLGSSIKDFSSWITYNTILRIRKLVNEKFANLDDLHELNEAYEYEFITNDQYFLKYQQMTHDYNAYQFMTELSKNKWKLPFNIQWYVVSRIIELLDYKDRSDEKNKIKLKDGSFIHNVLSLVHWLLNNVSVPIYRRAEDKICLVLSDDTRWFWFENDWVQSPGEANIRKRLDEAYQIVREHSQKK